MLSFLTESTKDFRETETIGGFGSANGKNSFDSIFESAYNQMNVKNINPMVDIQAMVRNPQMMSVYKNLVLENLNDDCARFEEGSYANLYEQVSALWDNCVDDFVKESTRVGQLLPFQAMDLPVLVKQHLKAAAKDIIQAEVTKSPVIKKHVERKWLIAKSEDGTKFDKYEYPQCFFNGDYEKVYKAGKGLPIAATPVALPLFNYDLITNRTTGGNKLRDKITTNLKIVQAITANGSKIPLDMRINLADGSWLGGKISGTYTYDNAGTPATETVEDYLSGRVDFIDNAITLNAANGKIVSVVFQGFLSNELNERSATIDYSREEFEWKVEDGFRMNVPYSLEELEDAKALLDIDLYKKTYDNLSDILIQMEDSGVLQWLDDEFEKYDGLALDPLGFNSFIKKHEFDCTPDTPGIGFQSEYIEKMLKFHVDRFIIGLSDTAKLEDMTFVLYGNPRYISLLGDSVNWVVKSGDMVGGIKANYSYGVMTSGGVKIQVVSLNKINTSTTMGKTLRIIPYPLNPEQMTFKYYKYTTHILTTQNSGYKASDRPGGSATNLMGTTRNAKAAVQGIQGSVSFLHDTFVQ